MGREGSIAVSWTPGFGPIGAYDHNAAAVSTYNRNIPGKVAHIADLSDASERVCEFPPRRPTRGAEGYHRWPAVPRFFVRQYQGQA